MNIRKANKQDIEKLIPIMLQVSIMHIEARPDIFKTKNEDDIKIDLEKRFDENENIIIIEEDNVVQGVLIYKIKEIKNHINIKDSKVLWIDDLVVDEKQRGKGIGKMLMGEAIRLAQKEHCTRVDLNCWEFNENAIKFYEKIGMTTQRRIMELNLN